MALPESEQDSFLDELSASSVSPFRVDIGSALSEMTKPENVMTGFGPLMAGQNLYGQIREQALDRPFLRGMRSGLSTKPEPMRVPFGMAVREPITTAGATLATSTLSPERIAREAQGVALDAVSGVGGDAIMAKAPALLAKSIVEPAARATEGSAGRALNFYIKPRAAGYRYGGNPGRAVVKHIGPQPNKDALLESIVSKKNELMNELGKRATSSNTPVDVSPIFKSIATEVQKMRSLPSTFSSQVKAHQDLALDLLRAVKDSGGKIEGGKVLVSPSSAVKLRQLIGELPSWSQLDPKLGSLTKTARKSYGTLNEEIGKALPGSRELNRDVADLIGAEGGIRQGMQREQNKYPLGLMDVALGTAIGLPAGGPAGIVPGALISKALRSAPAITTFGATAGGIGKALRGSGSVLRSLERPTVMGEIFRALRPKPKSLVPKTALSL